MESTRARKRFLIVEDEAMIALLLEDYLADLGYEVAGVADNVDDALAQVQGGGWIDAAILDVNVRGRSITPVADALKAVGTPFCFMTGYGAGVETGHPGAAMIGKPFDLDAVRRILAELTGEPEQG
jgi:DNA-binding NtrC family response regulator